MKRKILSLVLSLLLVGCSQATPKSITLDGSTSMEKVVGILSEVYNATSDVKVTYNPTGSKAGITAALEGRSEIGLSSRYLKDEEKKDLNETILALDGIALIVNPDNPVSDLSVEQISNLYTGKVTNWKEVGGTDGEVVLIGREAGSGTRDGFESITNTKDKCQYRQELTSTGDVITAVSQNPNAIGYASLASISDKVKVLLVNGVAPSEESVQDGSYQIQRPFVLVTKKDKPLSKEAQAFFDFMLSKDQQQYLLKAGVVPVK